MAELEAHVAAGVNNTVQLLAAKEQKLSKAVDDITSDITGKIEGVVEEQEKVKLLTKIALDTVANEGKECYNDCGKQAGSCPNFCGELLCCKQGEVTAESGGNCNGNMGDKTHTCVANPARYDYKVA